MDTFAIPFANLSRREYLSTCHTFSSLVSLIIYKVQYVNLIFFSSYVFLKARYGGATVFAQVKVVDITDDIVDFPLDPTPTPVATPNPTPIATPSDNAPELESVFENQITGSTQVKLHDGVENASQSQPSSNENQRNRRASYKRLAPTGQAIVQGGKGEAPKIFVPRVNPHPSSGEESDDSDSD
ncbi:hypothetical protein PIB30_061419 [Stylosanthes scabra]|uniref:Uncharacterized protein n=1 Tax=Stylosanthes scabra TaxID=79078 RepID=A0ABU6XKL8_9FABA|nr:hypothetical protein [Stylosanthes scabra]